MTGLIKRCAKEQLVFKQRKNMIKFCVRNHCQRFLDDKLEGSKIRRQEDSVAGGWGVADDNQGDSQASSCTWL